MPTSPKTLHTTTTLDARKSLLPYKIRLTNNPYYIMSHQSQSITNPLSFLQTLITSVVLIKIPLIKYYIKTPHNTHYIYNASTI